MMSWGWNLGWKLRMHWYSVKKRLTFGISFKVSDFLKHSLWIKKYLPRDFEKRLEMLPKFCFLLSITGFFIWGKISREEKAKKVTGSADWTKNEPREIHWDLLHTFHPHDIVICVEVGKSTVRILNFSISCLHVSYLKLKIKLTCSFSANWSS